MQNDMPRDPLSLRQYFNQTYRIRSLQKSLVPIAGGLLALVMPVWTKTPGHSKVAAEAPLDSGDVLLSTPEIDMENTSSFPSSGPSEPGDTRRLRNVEEQEHRVDQFSACPSKVHHQGTVMTVSAYTETTR